jgi:hypothetical protein
MKKPKKEEKKPKHPGGRPKKQHTAIGSYGK